MKEAGFVSPFLEKPRLLESEIGFVIYDGFPVSEGHCLVVPHRVYANYFDSTKEEIVGLQALHRKGLGSPKIDVSRIDIGGSGEERFAPHEYSTDIRKC